MSIELKQAAQMVIDAFDAFGDADDFESLFELTQKMRALRTAIQQAEAQQPSSKEHLFELWWEAHMPNATQEQAWTAFTAAVASNGVGIAAQQPATTEPMVDVRCEGCGYMTHHREHMGCVRAAKQHTHQAPSVLKDDQIAALVNKVRDIARMFHDHQSLRERIAIELVPALKTSQEVKSNAERYRWLRSLEHCNEAWCLIGSGNANSNLDAAIDAAMLSAKEK